MPDLFLTPKLKSSQYEAAITITVKKTQVWAIRDSKKKWAVGSRESLYRLCLSKKWAGENRYMSLFRIKSSLQLLELSPVTVFHLFYYSVPVFFTTSRNILHLRGGINK